MAKKTESWRNSGTLTLKFATGRLQVQSPSRLKNLLRFPFFSAIAAIVSLSNAQNSWTAGSREQYSKNENYDGAAGAYSAQLYWRNKS